MSNTDQISFVNQIYEGLAKQAGMYIKPLSFRYRVAGGGDNYFPLSCERIRDIYSVQDDTEEWSASEDGFELSTSVVFEYPTYLYGSEGIVPVAGELGVCIIWSCSKTGISGVIHPIESTNANNRLMYSFLHEFKPGEVDRDVRISIVCYLAKSAAHLEPDESCLNNTQGFKLGTLYDCRITFGKDYMLLPIQIVDEKDQGLWWLQLGDWDDPTTEMLHQDAVCIMINKANPAYSMVENSKTSSTMISEILASSLTNIFIKIDQDCNMLSKVLDGDATEFAQESIATAMRGFASRCYDPQLDYSKPERLQRTILTNVERMVRGDFDAAD